MEGKISKENLDSPPGTPKHWLIAILLVAAVIPLALVYLSSWKLATLAPLALEYEGPCLWAAAELANGGNIYAAERLESSPYAVTIYTPLYLFVCSLFIEIGSNQFTILRLASILSWISGLILFYRLLRLWRCNIEAALAGVFLLASFNSIWSWSWKGRVDMLALALTIATLYFYSRYLASRAANRKEKDLDLDLFLSSILAVLAIFTKQSAAIAPLIIFVDLLIKKKSKPAFIYGAVTAISSAIAVILLESSSSGGFMAHITYPARMPFDSSYLVEHLSWFGIDWCKVLLLLVLLAIVPFTGNIEKTWQENSLPLLLLLASGAVSLYTMGTLYANVNHAFICMLGICWLIALNFKRAPKLTLGLAILSIGLSTYICNLSLESLKSKIEKMPEQLQALKSLSLSDKRIFTEDPSIGLLLGAREEFVDIATFLQVWRKNEPNENLIELESLLEQKEFAMVMINRDDDKNSKSPYFWDSKFLAILRKNYNRAFESTGNGSEQIIYLPKIPK